MFRGFSTVSIDIKGRLAVPSRFRERLTTVAGGCLIQTLSPLDRTIWLYPITEWEVIENKLAALSDFDKQSRRAKQMMRGYATDCQLDTQGRILLSQELRDYAENGIKKEELVFMKNAIGQRDALRYETGFQKAGFISRILDYNLPANYIEQQNKILKNITKNTRDLSTSFGLGSTGGIAIFLFGSLFRKASFGKISASLISPTITTFVFCEVMLLA